MFKQQIIDISRDFKFCLGAEWNESESELVCLPHCVKLAPANSSGCRNYQGVCIYEKSIFIPSDYEGKKLIVEFGGAMGVSRLYINGTLAAEHFCGYIPFVADIGEFLRYGEENTLRIVLDNSDDPTVPPGKPQRDLDFTYEGGLYRKASLKVFEPLYITHPLLAQEVAGGGIFVHYSEVSDKSAKVHAKVHIKNEFSDSRDYELALSLIDADGSTVASDRIAGSLESGSAEHTETVLDVASPSLWSIDSPYLYTLRAEIFSSGELCYSLDTSIGIRTFRYTTDDGVIFNGKSHRFSGVNYHTTWPYIGNAVPDSLLIRDMMKLKEMGCENIRSHYPLGDTLNATCNRLGMTVVVSNPGWQFCREGLFMERALHNMRQIVRWLRNEPCIILWEPILNESKMNYEVQLGFSTVVHEEYPYPDCYTASDYGPTDVSYHDYVPGMIGYEDYGFIERRDNKERPVWTREYGDDPDNFTDQNTVWRMPRGFGDAPMVDAVDRMLKRYRDCEIESSVQYIDVYNNPKRCGYGIWPGISHNRGYHINPCYGGHLDLFRVEKFSYYFMKSQQDRSVAGDVLYIASWWSDVSPDAVTVYSNADEVELWCDGELVARQRPDEIAVKHPPFTFEGVRRYKRKRPAPPVRSSIRAVAFVDGKAVSEHKVVAPGVPYKLSLCADTMGIAPVADGSDIVAVRCLVLDREGGIVPLIADRHPILFEIEGEGEIVGDSSILANPVCADAGVATVLVRTTQSAGQIKIKARLYFDSLVDTTYAAARILPGELVIESV